MLRHFRNFSVFTDESRIEIFVNNYRWFSLPFGSSINQPKKKDVDGEIIQYTERESEDVFHAEWAVHSSCWEKKIYLLDAKENGIYYRTRVVGGGRVQNIEFFNSGERSYEVGGYLLPIAGHADYSTSLRTMVQEESIGLWYQAPPMYCFPFFTDQDDLWFGIGIVAKPGEYNFDRFIHHGLLQLELPLYGQTTVDGEWESQGIWIAPAQGGIDVLRKYSAWHYDEGLCKRARAASEAPRWWKGPIFCGWGSQLAFVDQLKSSQWAKQKYLNFTTIGASERKEYATQEVYQYFSDILDREDLHPAYIIIDSRWQKSCGAAMPDPKKWPDLRAYTDAEHKKGRKVVLWFKAWNNEGLDEDECIMDLCRPVAADPFSPKYQNRVKNMMYKLLSADDGCYNCDGFKIDFANCMPLGTDVVSAGNKYGVELLKALMILLHDSAKAVKSDALINCSACHPYFAEICDQARLHDYNDQTRLLCSTMRFREKLFHAALPDVLIDTDEGGIESHREFVSYMKLQPNLGVPDLYNLLPRGQTPMDADDFNTVRQAWSIYIARIENS